MYPEAKKDKTGPLYRQLVEQFTGDITRGKLPPGYRLPTVREMAAKSGISQGTIKHAYDILEQSGLIRKTRGSGTFVSSTPAEPDGSKTKALRIIDETLDRLRELSFSLNDIRIFFDLKLREREERLRLVAAVDCSPEALSVMTAQIRALSHTGVSAFLLDDVLRAGGPFNPPVDLVVTTPTHYEELIARMLPGSQLCRLVMTIATATALELAALPPQTRLGIITASKRFAEIMLRACKEYAKTVIPSPPVFFGDYTGIEKQIRNCGRLLLPPNYELFASRDEAALLRSCEESRMPIFYHYQVQRGSLLFLEEQVEKIFETKKEKPQTAQS